MGWLFHFLSSFDFLFQIFSIIGSENSWAVSGLAYLFFPRVRRHLGMRSLDPEITTLPCCNPEMPHFCDYHLQSSQDSATVMIPESSSYLDTESELTAGNQETTALKAVKQEPPE